MATQDFGIGADALNKILAESRYLPESAAVAERSEATIGGSAADAPPLLIGGESVAMAENVRLVVSDTGQILMVPKRSGHNGQAAFVDWVNFTVHETTAHHFGGGVVVTDHEMVLAFSEMLEDIFGYGIVSKNESGRNFYKNSYVLGDGYGLLCHGGQRNTVLVMVSGAGLAAARVGWEQRLYDFLTIKAIQPRITRLDLAYDDYDGRQYNVDRAKQDFEQGLFNNGGRMPDCEQRGNWFRPNGKGRTFYVGHRVNGKFARIYEKGKQLGDASSTWCRVEVEFKSVDRLIPFDSLLRPGEYLSASYPAFFWISERQERIKTQQKATLITYEAMLAWLKRQCGAALSVAAKIEGDVQKVFDLVAQTDKIPSRLIVPHYANSPVPLHKRDKYSLPVEILLDKAFI
jgi:phage replication initiation protein